MSAGKLVVFDAPARLRRAFFENGFRPYGRQPGAWFRLFADLDGEEARDLAYEMSGIGLLPQWRPAP